MSEVYLKARVLLLDENTGKSIGECEIVSNSKEIFYSNSNPLPKAVGNMPAGTTFDKASLSDILDDLLYDKTSPYISRLISSNGDINNIDKDINIIRPMGSQVDDFTISMNINFGSYDKATVKLCIYTDGMEKSESKLIQKVSDSDISSPVSFDIVGFNKDASILFEVTSGNDRYISPEIKYKFVSPIWVGWIKPDTLNEIGELDKTTAEDNFQELIDHNFKTLNKRFVDKSDQEAYIVPGINYDTREHLNPCILVPQTWGEVKRISDINGNNITNSFAHIVGLDINNDGNNIEHYIAYVCRHSFDDDSKIVKGITYEWNESIQDTNMANIAGNGIPTITGFSVQSPVPLDDRFYRKTYGELLSMLYPYPGLQTYVEDINTTFRFERGHWTPVSTKTHVVESIDELTEDLGGWDDLAINAMDGKIWKKRYNNQWERYGDIKAEDGKVTFELNKEDEIDANS